MKPSSPIIPGHDLPETIYAKDQPPYQPLPVWRDEDGMVLSRWHCTWRERLRILITGDVYLWQVTCHEPLQPVQIQGRKPLMTSPLIFKKRASFGTLRVYWSARFRLIPVISFIRRSHYFRGGICGAWLRFSFEYDHQSPAQK